MNHEKLNLGQILGRAEKGAKFRFYGSPQIMYEVLSLETVVVNAKEVLVGYWLQERSLRVLRAPDDGKVFMGVCSRRCSEEEIQVTKPNC